MKIGFFGAGKMAEGILSAIEDKKGVVMAEKVAERAADLKRKYGVATTADVKEVAKKAKFVFLAVRPQDVDAVAAEVKPLLTEKHTIVSIVAGKTLAKQAQEGVWRESQSRSRDAQPRASRERRHVRDMRGREDPREGRQAS